MPCELSAPRLYGPALIVIACLLLAGLARPALAASRDAAAAPVIPDLTPWLDSDGKPGRAA